MKTAYLFSGQGSQYSGMGRELFEKYPETRNIFDCGSDILGFDLKKACFEYDEPELAKTAVSQPAIYAVSLIALHAAKQSGIEASAVAGHSLGEYAAMTAAGMISTEDGFSLLKARAAAMQKCADEQGGAMYAVIGLSPEEIAEVCEKTGGYVVPVNFNSPQQTVIAGEEAAASAAAEAFADMGKRAVKLNVSSAFHSKLMEPAAEEFLPALEKVEFKAPQLDFYCNLTGAVLNDSQSMLEYLARHLVSPVQFTSELGAMQKAGYDCFVELGPGKVLTGLVKRTLKGLTAVNIEDEKTLSKAVAAFNA